MKTKRLRDQILRLDFPLNICEIEDEINERMRNGTDMHTLINVLSAMAAEGLVRKIGKVKTTSIYSRRNHSVTLWDRGEKFPGAP